MSFQSAKSFGQLCGKALHISEAEMLLLDVAHILDQEQIPFLLVFGTLLGAYRDNALIEYDTDLDIAILHPEQERFRSALQAMRFADKNIYAVRYEADLVSLERGDTYMDVYLFKRDPDRYRLEHFWINPDQIENGFASVYFLGRNFNAPKPVEEYLKDRYGETWQERISDKHATQ